MKALVLTGVKKFEIQNMPTPQIEPDEVLINTAYAGVCGTDHDLYDGRPGSAAAVPPIVLGHEILASLLRSALMSPMSSRETASPSTRTSTAASANSA